MDRITSELKVTSGLLEEYLAFLAQKGKKPDTISDYRCTLEHFFRFLPEDKRICAEAVEGWRNYLTECGYAVNTVNAYISTINSFLQYVGKPHLKQSHFVSEMPTQPELTRAEYLRLLDAAKRLGKERIYLIMKTLGSLGLTLQDLPLVTAEAVRMGVLACVVRDDGSSISGASRGGSVSIPAVLQAELLQYAERKGIESGSLFITSGGAPLERKHIWRDMQCLCAEADVQEEKVNARCLSKMYKSTCREIQDSVALLAVQAYHRLLEQEQIAIGWNL